MFITVSFCGYQLQSYSVYTVAYIKRRIKALSWHSFFRMYFTNSVNGIVCVGNSHLFKMQWPVTILSILFIYISSPLPCLFVCLFSPHRSACGILVPWPGIKPLPPAVEGQSPDHWTAREFPSPLFLYVSFSLKNILMPFFEYYYDISFT